MSEVISNAFVLSNNSYAVLSSEKGGGYSAWRGLAITRWQPDPAADAPASLLYLRDLETGEFWSTADASLAWREDRVLQMVEVQDVALNCETGVLQQADVELRRIMIRNHGEHGRELELTTYTELCLNTPAADAAHPAFSKLFVQTDFDAASRTLLAWRRLRSPDDRPLWVAQRLVGAEEVQVETDRARFIGRTRNLRAPAALAHNTAPSGATGAVLDPIFSFRCRINIPRGQEVQLLLLQAAAASRAEAEAALQYESGALATSRDRAALGLPAPWLANLNLQEEPLPPRQRSVLVQREEQRLQLRGQYGRFSADGREYIMEVGPHLAPTPQPWINVIANEQCGFLVSETGAGYTWTGNSRENRLTPWSNDPVSDGCSEAIYLRDEESGEFWSVLPAPRPAATTYEVRHGFGYSSFQHEYQGVAVTAALFVPGDQPARVTRVQLRNTGARARKLSLISYAQLVLGHTAAETRGSVVTSFEDNIIFARNPQRGEFSQRVAFAAAFAERAVARAATGSRRVFLGEAGSVQHPAALESAIWQQRFGEHVDPCAALGLMIELEPGATITCAFVLGEAVDETRARDCVSALHSVAAVADALARVQTFWRELLERVQISTPVPALDVMFNGWLAYQNLACRMWARSAFYQSGGAFGFRDQLQDSSALLYLDPLITRDQILLHAAHQFQEGDVLHWWHPPTSKGIRTRFSDDLLWLPYITHFYLARTGDDALLAEEVRFVSAPELNEGEDERFVQPRDAGTRASLYEHCCLAIDRSLTSGVHGLPLMGVGDWNDGMNRVGREGRGESVWLGFFLFDILNQWIPLCEARSDRVRVRRYRQYRQELHEALNSAGWDGAWYRRAYYDNGTPLGSADNDECRIDALAQSWAVLARAADEQRAAQALGAMQEQLVDEAAGLIRLLTPAFDNTPHDPGYIKGYVPGVRENGGQYTHAALWAVRALAEHGEHERAAALLELISPVTRNANAEVYRGEPYVIAADVYGEPPHVGRAGWTWYTGSAGWMYRVLLESILGFELVRAEVVRLRPCMPSAWPGYTLRIRCARDTIYTFEVERSADASSTSEGRIEAGAVVIPLTLDGREHTVRVRAGADVRPQYQPWAASDAPLLRTTSA